jgi:Zn-dependent protease
VTVSNGYLTLGKWRGADVRAHWTLPLGAAVFSGGRFVPGFWLGFFLLVLIHEVGHALLVRRFRCRVISIDIHGLGGVCRWNGSPSPIQRAHIAWGGVHAQLAVFGITVGALALLGDPDARFVAQVVSAFTTTNLWLIALNLLPVPPLDGAEAWKLPRLLRARSVRHRQRAREEARVAVRSELSRLDASDRDPPPRAPGRESVEEALRCIGGSKGDKN